MKICSAEKGNVPHKNRQIPLMGQRLVKSDDFIKRTKLVEVTHLKDRSLP